MRTVKIEALTTSYARITVPGGYEVSVEVVGEHPRLAESLIKTVRSLVPTPSASNVSVLDCLAKQLWQTYNVVSVSVGQKGKLQDCIVRMGVSRSFLRESESKVEGVEQVVVETGT